jgi:hypothetical protein
MSGPPSTAVGATPSPSSSAASEYGFLRPVSKMEEGTAQRADILLGLRDSHHAEIHDKVETPSIIVASSDKKRRHDTSE